jgi:AbrB family looped-hinge helix DNA binding protein
MARDTESTVVRPDQKGRIAIPEEVREALGIDESTPLAVSILGDRLIVMKLDDDEQPVREYSDEEIAEFLEADKISPELAKWARERYPSRLKWLLE